MKAAAVHFKVHTAMCIGWRCCSTVLWDREVLQLQKLRLLLHICTGSTQVLLRLANYLPLDIFSRISGYHPLNIWVLSTIYTNSGYIAVSLSLWISDSKDKI